MSSTKQTTVLSFSRSRAYGFGIGNDIFRRYLEQHDQIEYQVGERNDRPVAIEVPIVGHVVAGQFSEPVGGAR